VRRQRDLSNAPGPRRFLELWVSAGQTDCRSDGRGQSLPLRLQYARQLPRRVIDRQDGAGLGAGDDLTYLAACRPWRTDIILPTIGTTALRTGSSGTSNSKSTTLLAVQPFKYTDVCDGW